MNYIILYVYVIVILKSDYRHYRKWIQKPLWHKLLLLEKAVHIHKISQRTNPFFKMLQKPNNIQIVTSKQLSP